MAYILWLDDPAARSPDVVGTKGAALACLKQAGLPVPPGFCLTVEAAARQVAMAGMEATARQLDGLQSGSRAEWGRAANELRQALGSTQLEATVAAELQAAYSALQAAGLLAVRSSGLIEDRPGASFAGLFSSFLGVNGFEELQAAVRACWASRWLERVMAYARARNVKPGEAGLGVVVQALIPAEAAGTALSMDPTGRGASMVVNGAWGLGRAVAEGEIVPDYWRLERAGLAVQERRLGHKPLAAGVGPEGGEVWRRVAPERADAACLNEATVVQLGRLVLGVERVFGLPQEVEWALAAGRLWLLQSRPLVTTPVASEQTDPDLEHGMIVEGQPTSGGRVAGRARIVTRPEDLTLVQPGEILVTRFVRPSMSALLPRIAGLVVEAGGTTSHAATLARERQIPAVMGALGATRLIADGALVLVDGSVGRVYQRD